MVREAVTEVIFEAAALARKPRKRRKKKTPTCSVRGCKRRVSVEVLQPPVEGWEQNAAYDRWCKTHAKREADKLARQIVLDRDAWTCQRCGATEGIQWAHVLSRAAISLRWHPDNSLALCSRCHQYMTLHPVEWMDWVDDHYAETRIEHLRYRRRVREADGTTPDYAEIISDLRSKVGA